MPAKILIVDDEPSARLTLENLLAAEGYTLEFAGSGPEGLARASTWQPDVILSDVMMPGMDGFELCRRIRADQNLEQVPVVLLTALNDRQAKLTGLQAGADDFLSKPVDTYELRARLRTLTRLDRFRKLSEERIKLETTHQELLTMHNALRESEERFRSFMEQSVDGFMLADEQGIIIEWNHAIAQITGLPREQALGMTIWGIQFQIAAPDKLSSQDKEELKNALQEILRSGQSNFFRLPHEIKIQTASGAGRILQQISFAIPTTQGYRIGTVVRDITESRQAEETLRKSQALLAEAQRVGRIGHLEWTAADRTAVCSEELYNLLDLPRDQAAIPLETIWERLTPADRKQMGELDRKAFSQRENLDYEYCLPLVSGGERWLHQVGKITYDENGRPLRILSIFQDVTERKVAEKKLKESEGRHRGLFEDSPVSLWEEDFSAVKLRLDELRAQGIADFRQYFADHPQEVFTCAGLVKVLDVNRATVKLLGAAQKEDLLNSLAENLKDDAIQGFADELVSIAEGRTHFEWEGHNRKVDGGLIAVHLGWSAAFGHEKDLSRVLVSLTDITERKRTEEALRASEERFATVFHSSPNAIVIMRLSDNTLIDMNRAWEESSGWPREEALGKTPLELNFWVSQAEREHLRELTLTQDAARGVEVQMRHRSGAVRNLLLSAEVITLEGEPCLMTMTQDITEYKRAEKNLREREELLSVMGRTAHIGGWDLDAVTGEGHWTEEVALIHDLDPVALPSKEMGLSYYIGESQARITAAVQDAIQHAIPYDLELEITSAKGAHKWIRTIGHPVMENGRVSRLRGSFQDISDRKQAEEQLLDMERRYRALIENAPDGIVLIDINGKFKYASPSVERIFGYTQGDLPACDSVSMTHPEDLPMVLAELGKLIQQPGHIPTIQYRFHHKNGDWRWIESTFSNLLSTPSVEGIIINFRDIHERKLAEEELKKSQELLKEAQRIGRIGHMEWNGKGMPLTCSDELYNILGLPHDAVINQEVISHLMTPEERDRLLQLDRQAVRQRADMNYEYRIHLKDGSERWLHQMGRVSYDENDAPVRMMAIIQDVTEQKQAEEIQRENRSRLEMALKGANAAMWDWNVQTGEAVFNERWAEMLGYTLPELEPVSIQTWIDLCHPEDIKISDALLKKHFAGESEYYECEARMLHKNGSWVWVVDRGRVMEWDANGKPVRMFGTHLDVTERKKSEEQRRQQMEDLAFVNALNQAANQGRSMDQIVEVLRAESERIFHCSDVAVYLLSPDGRSVVLQHGSLSEPLKNRVEKVLGRSIPKLQIPIRQGSFFEKIIHSEQGMITSDPQGLQDWMTEFAETPFLPEMARPAVKALIPQLYKILGIRSVITIPLKSESKVLGALEISGRELFSEQDMARLQNVRAALTEILKRKQAEQNLMESEEKYRGLMESLDNAVSTIDADGRFLYMNDMAADHLGGVSQELIGRTMLELFPEPIATRQMAAIKNVFHTNREAIFETQSMTSDGPRWYRFALQPLHNEIGQVAQVLINATDIHDLKAAQQQLQELNRTLEEKVAQRTAEVQDLYDNAPTGYHSLDAEGRFVMINQTELDWLGYTREEILGHPAWEFLSANSQGIFRAKFPEFLQNGWMRDKELEFIRKDGRLLPVSLNATAVRDEAGRFVMSRSTIFDITERKRAESDLRESEKQNRLLFEESPVPVTLLNQNGLILRANRAYEQLTNLPRSELYGKTVRELGLVDAETVDRLQQAMLAALTREEKSAVLEHSLLRADGTRRTVESRIYLLTINQASHILITTSDISVYKQAEEALRLANSEMERALRLKDEFLANMSHELRTPLNAILGISESLGERVIGPLNEKQQKYVQTILESGQHLLSLINDILDLAKINAGKVEMELAQADIAALAQSSLRMVRELAQKKGQSLNVEIDPAIVKAWVDERRLKQMLVNLLSNAVKFTPQGGSIGLNVSINPYSRALDFVVWDTGIGIHPDDLPRLFQPFVQLDASLTRGAQGTGLGLVLVSQMARLHGGSIQVESTPGSGSRFTISIPWVQAGGTAPLRPSKQPPVSPGRPVDGNQKPKILLVEDTEVVKMLVNDYLTHHGYRVYTAGDGFAGLALAQQIQPDVILMDVMMPEMDGLETTRQLRTKPGFERTPIIALTAMAMSGDRENCLAAGMNEYLSKPVYLPDLLKVIEQQLKLSKDSHDQHNLNRG